ncbi:hypothetical protein [Actinocrispum sp. NPDC049592]|uniref:hypothetical protein n=1 Tax=Actinocrispum sp. NPDC049592 TaxID=3154835 RepID=UPI00344787FA
MKTPSTLVYDETTMGVQSITSGQNGTARSGIWVYQNGLKHLFDLDLGAQGGSGPGPDHAADRAAPAARPEHRGHPHRLVLRR